MYEYDYLLWYFWTHTIIHFSNPLMGENEHIVCVFSKKLIILEAQSKG